MFSCYRRFPSKNLPKTCQKTHQNLPKPAKNLVKNPGQKSGKKSKKVAVSKCKVETYDKKAEKT